ncbi:Maf family protein [Kaarinaea lacus]
MSLIVLASTSPFRRQLLSKLNVDFTVASPKVDEHPHNNEQPNELVKRLAKEKALAVAQQYPDALIIGSDQVAVLNNQILGKPNNHENAVKQLKNASGRRVDFLTGLCVYNSQTHHTQLTCVPFTVIFRQLTNAQIERYLNSEKPYNCAGSFKSEGLGIALFEKLEGDDPNTLIGLPLIELVRMLQKEGIEIP